MSDLMLIHTYKESNKLVERFAQYLLKECQNESDVESVKQLGSYISYFSNEIPAINKRKEVFEKFCDKADSATDTLDCNAVLKDFQEEIEKLNGQLKIDKNCEEYKNFIKMISERNSRHNDSIEIRTVSERVGTVDPISKLPFNEPVKNQKCGHTYEKIAILELIEQNPRTKCPIPGCSVSDFVTVSDLILENTGDETLNGLMDVD